MPQDRLPARHDPVDARPPIEPPGPTRDGDDARLVELARAGDDQAFGALVVRYERRLIRVIVRLVRDEELARDLAQDTFTRVYTRLDRFDTSRRFGPWLLRVGVNLAVDHLRRRVLPSQSIDHPHPDRPEQFDLTDPAPDPLARAEMAEEVHRVIDLLPLPERTILVLRDLEGYPTGEVAAIVGRQEATVRWRLARARELFREAWEQRDRPVETSSEPTEGWVGRMIGAFTTAGAGAARGRRPWN